MGLNLTGIFVLLVPSPPRPISPPFKDKLRCCNTNIMENVQRFFFFFFFFFLVYIILYIHTSLCRYPCPRKVASEFEFLKNSLPNGYFTSFLYFYLIIITSTAFFSSSSPLLYEWIIMLQRLRSGNVKWSVHLSNGVRQPLCQLPISRITHFPANTTANNYVFQPSTREDHVTRQTSKSSESSRKACV